ncbi:MAG TPA: PilZ domain-containing protein [Anaeromyxobacter sp.]|nr:PilZ domain-containing protein [Anaeromyxobacter sp.]
MDATHETTLDEIERLEHERERIEHQLRTLLTPAAEAMLLDERRWVVRRKRELDRIAVSSRAALWSRGVSRPCQVRDVSAHGAGVDTDFQPNVGDPVRLILTDLDESPAFEAVVRHVTGRRVGLEFVPRTDAARAAAELLAARFSGG